MSTNAAADIAAERIAQDKKWGQQNHIDGTGPNTLPLASIAGLINATELAEKAKRVTDRADRLGILNWRNIFLEEVLEAFAEEDPAKLRAELVQTAAVAQAWIECIDRRTGS